MKKCLDTSIHSSSLSFFLALVWNQASVASEAKPETRDGFLALVALLAFSFTHDVMKPHVKCHVPCNCRSSVQCLLCVGYHKTISLLSLHFN